MSSKQPIPFGKYLLLDRINIGGMAEVWRAKAFGTGGFERLVAIKRILPNIAEDDEFIAMFQDEAKISVQLTHANICQIHELNRIGQSLYIAMEYVPGKDLRSIFDRCRKRGEPPPVPLVCYAVSKLCEGLDYAHRKKDSYSRDLNVVHRDVSPQNVLVSFEGEVKVIDFGIAKAAGKVTKTQAGILKGKFGYMSPEQIRGLPLDCRSDIFAIGVCLWELLTGERLFVGESDFAVLEKVRKADVLPPSTYNRRIPEALDRIVLRALAKDVDARYEYASELADELQRFLITSDSIFSRKDLMQYMKSTFAEELDRERARLAEYAEVKAPDGMLAAMETGALSPVPRPVPPGLVPVHPAVPLTTPSSAVFRPASVLPKLTAAAPQLSAVRGADGATLLVDGDVAEGRPLLRSVPDPEPAQTPTDPELAAPALTSPILEPAMPALVDAPRAETSNPLLTPADPESTPPPATPETAETVIRSRETFPPLRPVPTPEPESIAALAAAEPPPTSLPLAELPVAPSTPASSGPAPEATPPPPGRSFGGRWIWAAVVVAAILGTVVGTRLREPPAATLLLDLEPADARGRVHLNVNGVELGTPTEWPVLQKIPPGSAVVMVTGEGFQPFVGTVPVPRDVDRAVRLPVALHRTAITGQLVVVPDPEDAEVRLNGSVVKKASVRGIYVGEVPIGTEQLLEVQHPGYRKLESRLTAHSDEPVNVRAALEPLEVALRVTSTPAGAAIFSGERQLGVTPATLRIPATTSALTFRKRCFDTTQVYVRLPDSGMSAPVRTVLRRVPGCR